MVRVPRPCQSAPPRPGLIVVCCNPGDNRSPAASKCNRAGREASRLVAAACGSSHRDHRSTESNGDSTSAAGRRRRGASRLRGRNRPAGPPVNGILGDRPDRGRAPLCGKRTPACSSLAARAVLLLVSARGPRPSRQPLAPGLWRLERTLVKWTRYQSGDKTPLLSHG